MKIIENWFHGIAMFLVLACRLKYAFDPCPNWLFFVGTSAASDYKLKPCFNPA
jgi:hypothetical protein